MALIDIEGFSASSSYNDFVNYNLFPNSSTSTTSNTIVTSGGPFGDNYVSLGGINGVLLRYLPSAYTTFFTGMRMRVDSGNGTSIQFLDGLGNVNVTITFNPNNGVISAYRGTTSGTLLGSSAVNAFPVGTAQFFFVEIGCVIASGTGGSVVVRINTVTVLNLTSQNTLGGTNANCGIVRWNASVYAGASNYPGMSFTHWYFNDNSGASPWNTYLGDVRVSKLTPTGAGASTQFTPVGLGSNWQNAAVYPPQPTVDYNSDTVIGHSDLFTVSAMPVNLTTVYGVQVKGLFLKSDSGNRSMANQLRSVSTTVTGGTLTLNTTAQYSRDTYQTDPATSAQWTQSAVNAAQIGYTIIA